MTESQAIFEVARQLHEIASAIGVLSGVLLCSAIIRALFNQ